MHLTKIATDEETKTASGGLVAFATYGLNGAAPYYQLCRCFQKLRLHLAHWQIQSSSLTASQQSTTISHSFEKSTHTTIMTSRIVCSPPKDSDEEPPKILVGIDFGTAYNAVAYSLGSATRTDSLLGLPPSSIRFVDFNNQPQVKCQLAWRYDKEQWEWGRRVDDLVESRKILESGRISMFKLGLDQSDESREPRNRVQNQLQDIPSCAWDELGDTDADDFEKLITIYLKKFWADSRTRISQDDLFLGVDPFDGSWDVACSLGVPKYV